MSKSSKLGGFLDGLDVVDELDVVTDAVARPAVRLPWSRPGPSWSRPDAEVHDAPRPQRHELSVFGVRDLEVGEVPEILRSASGVLHQPERRE